jgi:nucleoside-diphosphate-sugar epimerase
MFKSGKRVLFEMAKILVTGPFGQIGSDLVPILQKREGKENVICLGHNNIPSDFDGILEQGDTSNREDMQKLIDKYEITEIYHLASLLSATGEKNPQLAWEVNIHGLKNLLDLAIERKIKIFWPSSIAVFGPTTPRDNTPQQTIIEPTTMYGVTKLTGEALCNYYFLRYGVDVRSLRYPGLIGYKATPGGGTTDYAVAIFYEALKNGKYECYLKEDTTMPMMYMDDAIKATLDLMKAPKEKIKIRTSYNLAAISFSPKEIATEIKKHIPEFTISYAPDSRQAIADSWPRIIDDSKARGDWGWTYSVDLAEMTKIMLEEIKKKI